MENRVPCSHLSKYRYLTSSFFLLDIFLLGISFLIVAVSV